MLKSNECIRYIVQHQDMDVFVDVVPVEVHAQVAGAVPVVRAFVMFIEDA